MLFAPTPVMLNKIPSQKVAGANVYLTMPSNLFLYHLTVSCWSILWDAPMRVWQRLRLATRSPGRVLRNTLYQYMVAVSGHECNTYMQQ